MKSKTYSLTNQQFRGTAVWSALGLSVGFSILITIGFSLLRPRINVVYAPKLKYADEKHAPPRLKKGIFDWLMPIATMKESQLVDKIGLDATVFLRFTRMCRNMFVVITVVAIGIILPANMISSRSNTGGKYHTNNFWTISTVQYVPEKGLWVHVVCSWIVNIVMAFFLWHNYRAITRLRRQYFESPDYLMSLHSRTLMFTDIPPASRTDEGILRLADGVEQTSGLPRAAVARNVKELPELIERHEKAVRDLESVLSKYLKNPDKLPATRPTMKPEKKYRESNGSEKVDAIDYLTERISQLEIEIRHVRESIDKRNPMPFGFASYERIEDAHTVAYAAENKHPQGTTIRLAPRPQDLIWKNLPLTRKERNWKRFINNFWISLLTVIWIAPNALTAIFLSNLSNLASLWPAFQHNFYAHGTWWAIVQGIAAPGLSSLVYVILPIIFRRISINAGDTTKSSRERHVAAKLYAFFVFNNLIVFSLFSAIWSFVTLVINHEKEGAWRAIKDGHFFKNLLSGLVDVNSYWLTWLLQRNLGAAADLAQLLNLSWIWFMRICRNPTPRQYIEWTAPPMMDYAVYYNYFLFYATVALCFMTIQPLVIPITAFYFSIDYVLKKYLLLYVLVTKTESGGQFWRTLFNRLVFATFLADLVIAVVLYAAGNTWHMCVAMGPLPLLLLAFKIYCARTFDAQNEFYTKATLKDPEQMTDPGRKSRRNDRVGSKFGHPALYAKLMTPMVHAKAQHVLGEIYRGRLHPDGAPATQDYSDIMLDPMSHANPGKTARFAPNSAASKPKDLFEVVPESQLDFGYFKDRAEFADGHGGDGEMYGRPTDLVSERSGTPRSFMGRGGDSASSSRASSPSGGSMYGHSRHVSSQGGMADMHPALREQSPAGRGLYSHGNESERELLAGAQGVGFDEGREVLGLEGWRTGGSGYVGVSSGEGGVDQGLGYEAYRGRR